MHLHGLSKWTNILLLVLLSAQLYPQANPGNSAFVDVNVVAMTDKNVLTHQTVVVVNGKIAEIGPAEMVSVPAGASRISGKGKYLIPGLADMHVHVYSPEDLYLWMAHGVTTVLNLNGRPTHLAWRKRIQEGSMEGPMLYTAGPTIYIANTAKEGDSLAEAYHAAGYDCLKIYNDVTTAAFDALIGTAKKYNMLTVGHIPRQPGFWGVLKSGMAIAHAEEYMYTILADSVDERKIPDLAAATHLAGTTLIATLTAYDHIERQVENLDAILAQPKIKYIEPWITEEWNPETNRYSKKSGFKVDRLKYRLSFQKKMIAAMHKADVRILVGTDCVLNGMVSGESTLDEIEILAANGFTPYEALRSATVNAAEFLRASNDFGTIEKGKRADLILLDSDPLADIHAIREQEGVMIRGRWYSGDELQKKLEALPSRFVQEQDSFRTNLQGNVSAAMAFEREHDPFDVLLTGELKTISRTEGAESLKTIFQKVYAVAPDADAVQELVVNNFGYSLLGQKKFNQAIAVLTFNAELHPGSANAFDSLAEAYLDNGEKEKAIQNYRRALMVDPNFESSKKALEKLQ